MTVLLQKIGQTEKSMIGSPNRLLLRKKSEEPAAGGGESRKNELFQKKLGFWKVLAKAPGSITIIITMIGHLVRISIETM